MQRSETVGAPADDLDEDIAPWGHPPHAHAHGQFVTAVVGSGSLRIAGREHPFDASTGIWVPAGVIHAGSFREDLVPIAIELPMDHMPAQVKIVAVDTVLRSVLLARMREGSEVHSVDREHRLAVAIAQAPAVRMPLRMPTGSVTSAIAEHLRRAPADVAPLPAWAARLHVSVATIRRAFLAETGLTYSEWTTLFRLDLSVERLRAGESVAAVARATGFSANGYTLAFRRWTGLSPSEFRARCLG